MGLSRKNVAKALLEINAVTITDSNNLFTWASGIKSPIYCDTRLTLGYPNVRNMIASQFKEIILKEFPDVDIIAGTATGAIPHTAWLAEKLNLPMVYVRSNKKNHGHKKIIEGCYKKNNKVILIEDLLSTGGSSMEAAKNLMAKDLDVLGVLAIFSYNFPIVDKLFSKEKLKYKTLTDYNTLLTVAKETGYISENNLKSIKEWSKNPYMFTN